ncbi:S-methyl-5-thioribose-1-phosphate isomerase [Candidatus Woesearchaeota archaeon]|nr:S-methyl-5-thioribose-1-phosphate isomerase [Candidatus Woesearchaeota archaeon]
MIIQGKDYRTVWMEGNLVKMINQPLLPHKFGIIELKDYNEVHDAIKTMVVRGAPAIGATAAYGIAQAVLQFKGSLMSELEAYLAEVNEKLSQARPTAQDLFDGINYVNKKIMNSDTVSEAKDRAATVAKDYADRSADACKKIGEYGNELINENDRILTHCNAGALATVDYGTALSPIRMAHYSGKRIFVFADETRPRSQGSRLTAFELVEENIPHAIIADNAAGYYMRKKEINICIVGADRVAANGDVANKIGTYEKAVLAHENNIPFYVAIPLSTIDLNSETGEDIPIEERDEEEVLYSYGWTRSGNFERIRTSPEKSRAKNPAFDVTPARYITGLITPNGIIMANKEEIAGLFE